jgi:hypothetical protein
MTGLPDLNFPAFHAAAATLRDAGWIVVNPAENDEAPGAAWSDCLRKDIRLLMDCTGVALLDGWERSKGARLERHIALELGMEVHPMSWWLVRAEVAHAKALQGAAA